MPGQFAKPFFIAALLVAALAGCATRNDLAGRSVLPDDGSHGDAVKRAQQALVHLFPARYRATQRAIITAGGEQFTCDGLLIVSPSEGYHLALVSNFGVVTDLRLKPDLSVELLKVTPIFREDWSRNFVARDLRCLFAPPARLQPAGRLADGRLVLRASPDSEGVIAEYIFSADGARWQELDLTQKGKAFYRAVVRRYWKFSPEADEIPNEFEVSAPSYRLELRVAAISITPAATEVRP